MKNLLLLVLSMAIVNNLRAQQTSITNWLTQTDTLHDFSFTYPSDWTLKLPGTNTRFFVTSPKETDNDDFRENVNCIARVLEQKNFTIKMAEREIKESLAEKLKDFNVLRLEYFTWNGSETLEIDYTGNQAVWRKNLLYTHIATYGSYWRHLVYVNLYI
jgi:hypothetical protein